MNNEIPLNLSYIPVLKGFKSETKDAWGNDIIYEVNGTEVTLTSLGRDGKAGGQEEDADITRTFFAHEDLDDPFCSLVGLQHETYDIMSYIATRIQRYVDNNGQLPDNISILPELKIPTNKDSMQYTGIHNKIIETWDNNIINKTTDCWGKDVIYKKVNPTTFQLFSYGEDLKEGGMGQNSDMERRFELNDKGECVETHFNLRDK